MAFPPGLGIRILGSESTGREKMLEEETPTEGQVRIGGWVQLRARRSQALIVSPWFRRRGASRGPGPLRRVSRVTSVTSPPTTPLSRYYYQLILQETQAWRQDTVKNENVGLLVQPAVLRNFKMATAQP